MLAEKIRNAAKEIANTPHDCLLTNRSLGSRPRGAEKMNAVSRNTPAVLRIDDLLLDTGSRQVTRNGEPLNVSGLTFDLLFTLADEAPALVTYERLADQVWNGRPVSPETIRQRAKMLRHALADDAKSPRYFEPVRGQGYRLLVNTERVVGSMAAAQGGRRRSFVPYAAVAALIAIVGLLWIRDNAPPSVAVLPLVDFSEQGDQRHFADGIAEQLINELSNLDGLDVASRTESFFFRGPAHDLKTIGDTLGVSAVLEGSFRKSGDQIRITMQLVEVATGRNLWAKTFDRDLQDVFVVQDDIAASVAGALGVQLGVGGANGFRGAGTRNLRAYEAYMKEDYTTALQLDPSYAPAWGAEGIVIAGTMWRSPPSEAPAILERALEHVTKALELDPTSARAHSTFGTLMHATRNLARSEQAHAKALSLRRNEAGLMHYANMLMRNGMSTKALAAYEERSALLRIPDPHLNVRTFNVYVSLSQFDKARAAIEQLQDEFRPMGRLTLALNAGGMQDVREAMSEMPPGTIEGRLLFQPLLSMLDSRDRVLGHTRALAADDSVFWPDKYKTLAMLAAYFDEPAMAFDIFSREIMLTPIRFGTLWYPVMAEMRRLPGFKAFVVDIELDDYWRDYGWSDFCRPQGADDFVCE